MSNAVLSANLQDYKVLMTDGTTREVPVPDKSWNPETACAYLEKGGIIFFPKSPFTRSQSDSQFLLEQNQAEADHHKNVVYKPVENQLSGGKTGTKDDQERLRGILEEYSNQAQQLIKEYFTPYARNWKIDYASFRPIEEKGRKLRLHARNDLLHVDSFATRPIYGDRILRVFQNINPVQNRVWKTADTFEQLATTFQNRMNPPSATKTSGFAQFPPLKWIIKALGLKANTSSSYDNWMLNFHNFLKENSEFQKNCRKDEWQFPPGSTWLVFTDMVSHSVLTGQFALEQTFIISQNDLVLPEKAPINILRRLYGSC